MFKKLFLAAFCFVFVLAFCACAFAQAQDSLKVVELEGNVLALKAGQKNWKVVKVGDELVAGDKMKTAAKSSAMLVLNGDFKNVVKIQDLTEVVFESLRPVKMYMSLGSVLSKIDNLEKGSTFEIRTPTAVAGVAGTGFKTSYNAKNKRFEVAVHNGKVKVQVPEKTAFKNTWGLALAFAEGYTEYEIPADVKAVLDEAGLTQKALDALDREEWEQFINDVRELIREYEASGQADRGVLLDKVEDALDDADKNRDDRFEIEDIDKIEDRLKPEEKPGQGGTSIIGPS